MSAHEEFAHTLAAAGPHLIDFCARLAATDSRNPPGDTRAAARLCAETLADLPGVELREIVAREPVVNLLARVKGARTGRRLVSNGHLDTGLLVAEEHWSVPAFGGLVRDGKLFGLGTADMKAGVAAGVFVVSALARIRQRWAGEFVLTLAGDEGSGGGAGTRYLLDRVPEVVGDAMLSGDVGSPRVARFGEKGFLWLEVTAEGRAAGGAHPHLGINAVERLTAALARLGALACVACPMPTGVMARVREAAPASEALSGAGETDSMTRITLNVGRIAGGVKVNAVPHRATAEVDIRFPPGLRLADLYGLIAGALAGLDGITYRVLDGADPTWTDPDAEIVRHVVHNATRVLGAPPALSLRLGFSDARLYRERGVPAIVYGATAHNAGAPDEYITLEDLEAVFRVHALTAFDYLRGE